MAPEIFKSDYGPKCDVWALGIVLYMIITGTLPFLGKNREQVKESILNSDFLRPENCSEECADLIENLLCKDVTKRYTAAQALSHPWFSSERDIPDEQILLSEDTLNRMRSFSDQTKLRKAALTLLVKILDDAEVAYLRSVFEKIDYDKSGLLDTTELKQAVKESKINISERELELLIDNIDNNDNRMIDYTEFITSCIDIEKVLTEEKLNAIFDCFDVDHTGIITFDTIKRAFTKFGREIPDKEVIDIILKHDMNNDNEINFDEFKIMMMQLKIKV